MDVQNENGVIIHVVVEEEVNLNPGDVIQGSVEGKRRWAHMRHHTATHVVNEAAKRVLGDHIWQAGAQKSEERARLDISHFKRISIEELKEIERISNRTVMANIPVEISWMDRTDAEQKYGFVLYQGGVPPGKDIRILKVGTDVEACGGTHVSNTGLIGPIKLLKTERIQDGVERLEYAAGEAAVERWQEQDSLLRLSADVFSVSPEHLPETSARFFDEWKEYKKDNVRLKEELASARVIAMISEAVEVNGLRVIAKTLPSADIEELVKAAGEFTKQPDVVAILASDQGGAKIVAAAGEKAVQLGANSGEMVREMSKIVGGGGGGRADLAQGGGPDAGKIDEALECGLKVLRESLGL
ncbi:MAG: alanine--tRNA ligase, partial [ANME-2 cluster archaeon]